MTAKARLVLNDLRKAHSMLEIESDLDNYRVLWVSAISLARAVGHILDKVDSKESSLAKKVIKRKWRELNEDKENVDNTIFHKFIKSERDSLLKEYEFGILKCPSKLVYSWDGTNFNVWTDEDCLFVPLIIGHYTGEDGRDIIYDAIQWWDSYLCDIEKELCYQNDKRFILNSRK